MATLASGGADSVTRERRFFFFMSLALIAAALLGFGYFQYAGISSWGAPWWIHVHAVSQMAWLGFYALQNALVVRGDIALHRKLGVFGCFFAAWLVVAAFSVSYLSVSSGVNDGLFLPANILAMNWANLAIFAALFVAAIANRRRSDWHKRLMLSAVVVLSLPSLGRILIMLGIPSTLNRTLFVLSFIAVAMAFDRATRGRVHPAYYWGAGATVTMGLLIGGLPEFAPFVALANGIAG